MNRKYDVVVVGGRCAGSPLAMLLAREGLSVALVEQATFPRDTLSTHIFKTSALAFLNRVGVLSALARWAMPPSTTGWPSTSARQAPSRRLRETMPSSAPGRESEPPGSAHP